MITESYRQRDDETLVSESLKGNKIAFSEIVTKYQGMVARTIKGMLGDTVFSEDIGQEVFIKLFYSLSDFRGEAKLSTYIQKIAVNLTLNEIKRRKKFFSMFAQRGNNEMHEFDVADHGTEESRDAKEIVSTALNMLNPKFRIVVIMRMIQGYSTKETAEILDLPNGNRFIKIITGSGTIERYFGKTLTAMNNHELKELMIRSLNIESDPEEIVKSLETAGVNFEFSEGFPGKVIDRIYSAGTAVVRETEFVRNLTFLFYRIALPGIAAIILLLLSIFLMEGSFSLNSLLGLGSSNEESIICLLTGN